METLGFIWAGLYVEDLDKMIAFYDESLGLKMLQQGEDWAHFDAGGGSIFELFSGGKASPEPKRPDQQPLVLGFRVTHLEETVERLTDNGVLFGEIGQNDGSHWAQFYDPEGNRLEIKEIPAGNG